VFVLAFSVISQNFDNAAFSYASMSASFNHQLKFSFKCSQTPDALLDLRQPGFGNAVGCAARLVRVILQAHKRADGLDLEAKFTGMADKGQPSQVGRLKKAAVIVHPKGRRQQPDLLIITDCRHFHATLPGSLTN
jgi:hypothetical protein